jgi:hypothetical protein
MTAWIISFLGFLSQQLAIYLGILMLIGGVLGGLLTIVVFLSLRTFRESSCAFYLIIMSIFNIGNLLIGLFSRILITGFGIDWTLSSSFYCAFRWYCLYVGVLTSFTMICLATIDQYLATCSRPNWQQWSNIKLARRLSLLVIIFWILLGIPYMIYFNLIEQSTSHKVVCTSTNYSFLQYHIYVYIISLAGAVPIIITVLFGCLAYCNVQQLAHRTLPLIRRELDKQLTTIVLAQVVHNVFATIPYTIATAILNSPILPSDPIIVAQLQFANIITIYLYYLNYTVSIVH